MKPLWRILLNLLLPGAVATGVLMLGAEAAVVGEYGMKEVTTDLTLSLQEAGMTALVVGAIAYKLALLPSLLCTGIMEWAYRKKGLLPTSLKAVGVSTLCGLLASGLLTVLGILTSPGIDNGTLAVLLNTVGCVTGALTGAIIKGLADYATGDDAKRRRTRRTTALGVGALLVAAGAVAGYAAWYAARHPNPYDESMALTDRLVAHPEDTKAWAHLQEMAGMTGAQNFWPRSYGLAGIGQVGIRQAMLRPAATGALVAYLKGRMTMTREGAVLVFDNSEQGCAREAILSIGRMGPEAVDAAWDTLTAIVEAALRRNLSEERDVDLFALGDLGKTHDPAHIDQAIGLLTQGLARPAPANRPAKGDEGPSLRFAAASALRDLALDNPVAKDRVLAVLRYRLATATAAGPTSDPHLATTINRAIARLTRGEAHP